METPKVNIVYRVFDYLVFPFMWILGRFVFPVQESHPWNVKRWNWSKNNGLVINKTDKKAKFGHENLLGFYHMPIFGGFTKYVVIKSANFGKYWFVGWQEQIQSLPIKQDKVKLLVGKNGYTAYGLDSNGKELNLKVVGYGELGDNKFKGLRLF